MTMRRRLLAQQLAQLRKHAQKPLAEVGALLECSSSRVGQFESARVRPSRLELIAMLDLYGASDRLDTLEELRLSTNERGWWATYRLPSWLQAYIGLENDAVTMRRWTLELVPGMLQTEGYAYELSRIYDTEPQAADRYIAARMSRKDRLTSGDLTLSVVMSEALLWRTSCMGDVGVEQLRYLRDTMSTPGVDLTVLPFAVGGHPGMATAFTLLTFPDGMINPVAYQDHIGVSGSLADDHDLVDTLRKTYQDLRRLALDPAKTASVLEKFANGRKETVHAR